MVGVIVTSIILTEEPLVYVMHTSELPASALQGQEGVHSQPEPLLQLACLSSHISTTCDVTYASYRMKPCPTVVSAAPVVSDMSDTAVHDQALLTMVRDLSLTAVHLRFGYSKERIAR